MAEFWPFFWIALGVLISIVLPVLLGFTRQEFPAQAGNGPPAWVVKYVSLFLTSGFTALLALAIYRSQHPHDTIEWYSGLILGYAWESTIESTFYKITGKYANNPVYQPPNNPQNPLI